MRTISYDRKSTVEYAAKWAFSRNPRYTDFDSMGGDCTNFASQCIYAGSNVMNPTKTFGWYYYNLNNRSPSWSGVPYLYNFIVTNTGIGPYGRQCKENEVQPGDFLQLGSEYGYYHSPVIVSVADGRIYVAAHTFDAYMRPLDTYEYEKIRFIHIEGVRNY